MAEKKPSHEGSPFWQILFPTLVSAALLIALGCWFGLTASAGNTSRFAEISTVLLTIPVYIAALLFGLILVGMIYLVIKLTQGIPQITGWILELLEKIHAGVEVGTRSLARLVIEPAAFLAVFQRKRDSHDPKIKLND